MNQSGLASSMPVDKSPPRLFNSTPLNPIRQLPDLPPDIDIENVPVILADITSSSRTTDQEILQEAVRRQKRIEVIMVNNYRKHVYILFLKCFFF